MREIAAIDRYQQLRSELELVGDDQQGIYAQLNALVIESARYMHEYNVQLTDMRFALAKALMLIE